MSLRLKMTNKERQRSLMRKRETVKRAGESVITYTYCEYCDFDRQYWPTEFSFPENCGFKGDMEKDTPCAKAFNRMKRSRQI